MNKRSLVGSIREKLKLAYFSGRKYLCPICGYKSRGLVSTGGDFPVLKEKQVIGAGLRDGCCYKCYSNDREKLIFTYLKYKLDIFNADKKLAILHIAPEPQISKALNSDGFDNYICGDLFTEGYSYPDYVQNMNVLNIPYDDNYFDLIICNHVLEHVPNDLDAMKEIFRVLKKGGKAILQVPISNNTEKTFENPSVVEPKEREMVFGQFDHLRIYGQDYTDRLESAGFKTSRINIFEEFSNFGLVKEEDIFIGEKV